MSWHSQLWPVLWYSGAQNPFKEEPVSLHAWLGTSLRDKFALCLHLSSFICDILTWGSCDSSSILCYSSWTYWAISVKLFRGMDIKTYLNFCISEEDWGDQRGCKKALHCGKIENVPVLCLYPFGKPDLWIAWNGECQGKAKSLGGKKQICLFCGQLRGASQRQWRVGCQLNPGNNCRTEKHLKTMPRKNLVLDILYAYFQVGFKQSWFCSCVSWVTTLV